MSPGDPVPKSPEWFAESRGHIEKELPPIDEWRLFALSSTSRESLEAVFDVDPDEFKVALRDLTFVDAGRIHVADARPAGENGTDSETTPLKDKARGILDNAGVRPRRIDLVDTPTQPGVIPPPPTAIVELSPYHIWDEDPVIIGGMELINVGRLKP